MRFHNAMVQVEKDLEGDDPRVTQARCRLGSVTVYVTQEGFTWRFPDDEKGPVTVDMGNALNKMDPETFRSVMEQFWHSENDLWEVVE